MRINLDGHNYSDAEIFSQIADVVKSLDREADMDTISVTEDVKEGKPVTTIEFSLVALEQEPELETV